ncbi:MAG: tyrosine-type recombinase/integrase [Lachnospiraceae bacterium]|nr:tyrosine-type recombinase/integrase [Lachnospiraceae bacterium]
MCNIDNLADSTDQLMNDNEALDNASLQEFMVSLKRHPEIARIVINDMTSMRAKRLYVKSKHKQAIAQTKSKDSFHNGYWFTHVYVDGKRKVVQKPTEDRIYDYLYDFYRAQDETLKSYEKVFEQFLESKRDRGRSELTIRDYRRYKGFISESIRKKDIALITEDELRKWFIKDFLSRKPRKEAMKKMLQHIKAVFDFGMRNGYCFSNPAYNILAEDYYKFCNLTVRPNEERSFSYEEMERLREYCLNDRKNPHAPMMLVAMETGMRVGELAAIRKSDVDDEYIWVHRQQIIGYDNELCKNRQIQYVEYTKNERANPKGGRIVPITDRCRQALEIAFALPGESEFLFHHPNGEPVVKDSYEYYLRRRCKSLGIKISHNHAFRVAFNARLIEAGADSNERCLVLGHSMQTNERHYSFSDRRRVDDVKDKLNRLKLA